MASKGLSAFLAAEVPVCGHNINAGNEYSVLDKYKLTCAAGYESIVIILCELLNLPSEVIGGYPPNSAKAIPITDSTFDVLLMIPGDESSLNDAQLYVWRVSPSRGCFCGGPPRQALCHFDLHIRILWALDNLQ